MGALENDVWSQLLMTIKVNPVDETLAPGAVNVASMAYVPLIAEEASESTIATFGEVGSELSKDAERKGISAPDFVNVKTGLPQLATDGPMYGRDNRVDEAGGFLIS